MGLLKLIGLEPQEGPRTLRLFSFILLLTSSAVLARSAQRDLFLAAYPRSQIPDAFLLSAVFLCLLSVGISALAGRLGLLALVRAVLVASASLLLLGWLAVGLLPRAGPMAVYVLVEVLTGVLITQGWAVVTEVLDVRSAKRILPVVGLGAGLAWTVGGFAVGALAQTVSPRTLLLLAPTAQLLAVAVLGLVVREAEALSPAPERGGERLLSGLWGGVRYIVSEPLMRVMAAVITIELVVERVVDFQLLSMVQEQFGAKPGGVASFMGWFYGSTGVLTLLAPLLLSGRVMTRLGSTRTLLLPQLWLVLTSALFLFFPALWGMVLLAGGDRVLKQSLGGPSRSQILGAVPPVRRAQAGAILRGVVAALFSAVAALLLKALPDWPVHWLSVGALGLMAGLLVLTATNLRRAYLVALRRSVDSRRLELDEGARRARELDEEQLSTMRQELAADEERALFAASVLASATGVRAHRLLREGLRHPSERVRAEVASALATSFGPDDEQPLVDTLLAATTDELRGACLRALANASSQVADEVEKFADHSSVKVRALARACLARVQDGGAAAEGRLAGMFSSPDEGERASAAWALEQVPLPAERWRTELLRLLEDGSVAVRQAALSAASIFDEPKVVRRLVYALEEPSTAGVALDAFPRLGDQALKNVEAVLAEAPPSLVAWTASALSRSRASSANPLLQRLLLHAEPLVRVRASRALVVRRGLANWESPAEELLLRAIRAELTRGYALYATLSGLQDELAGGGTKGGAPASDGEDSTDQRGDSTSMRGDSTSMRGDSTDQAASPAANGALPAGSADDERRFLLGEIDSRIQEVERRLLALVALVADPRIARLSHHLRDASPAMVARILELIEQSLDHDAAVLVVPFLERRSVEERLRAAEATFDLPGLFRADPLAGIIELNDAHLRRCALLVFGEQLAKRYPGLFDREEHLLPLIERVRLLRHVPLFKGLTPEDLMKLAEIAELSSQRQGQVIFKKGEPGDVMCVVLRGEVEIKDQGKLIAKLGPNSFFGELALFDQEPRSADAVAAADTDLLNIGAPDLEALMERRPEIAREIIRVLAVRLRRTTEAMLRSSDAVKEARPR